ncbi:hypothetical protein ACIP4X_09935 [Streptomyces sp. NPDC088817]|uniref:hypothetical protein n=1 Tax=Streptomyces sp. NPDC088817 TaxID=3365907 RepID=UPI0037F6F8CF
MGAGAEEFAIRVDMIIDGFIDRIEAARDIINLASPVIKAEDGPRSVVQKFLSQLTYLTDEELEQFFALFQKSGEKSEGNDLPWQLRLLNSVWEEFKGKPWTSKLATDLHTMLRRPSRIDFLLESTVVSAVTSFEVLFSSLIASFLKVSPQALEAMSREKEREFSLRDLKGLSSIEEAVDLAISRRVDELMFGSVAEWRKFCIDKLNIKFEDLCSDWPAVQEIFQRRHVLVHAGGVASHRYVASVASAGRSVDVKVGKKLNTSEIYVHQTLDAIMSFGILLASSIGMKFAKEHESTILSSLHKLTYTRLLAKQDELVKHLCTAGEKIAVGYDDQLLFKVNGWIALKRTDPKAVALEMKQWDTSALEDRYKLAKMCLASQNDEALGLMKKMHSAESLSSEDVLEWPLFEELRNMPDYVEWSKNISLPFGISSILGKEFYLNPRTKTLHTEDCRLLGSSIKVGSLADYDPGKYHLCSICDPFPKQRKSIERAGEQSAAASTGASGDSRGPKGHSPGKPPAID